MNIPVELIRRLPKTDLHVHLDGSLRPETLLALGAQAGVSLPFRTPEEVLAYMHGRDVPDLAHYLQVFDITLAVLQTREALMRAAYELAEDAAHEGIWYMEVRFSPILHTHAGLTHPEIVEAVVAGLRAAEARYVIRTGAILCGIRTISPEMSLELARLTVSFKGRGVVGFDLAGAEKDYPAKDHREAFFEIRNHNVSSTVHAGEDFGPPSIHQALHYCGAHRIGHGVRLCEDGDLMSYVNDHRIPLEICLSSNLQTKTTTLQHHPFRLYFDAGLRVTLNTDNRLVSATTMSNELDLACRAFRLDVYDLRRLLIHGFKSSFLPYQDKADLLRSAVDAMDRLFEEYFPGSYHRLRSFL
ncbi:MAG: adenosine deaminase [Candidatus Eisenbacteria bacterium]